MGRVFNFTGFGLMQCDIIAIDFRFGLDAGFDGATAFDLVLPSALVLTVIMKLLGVGLMCSDAPPLPPWRMQEDKGRNEKGRL